MPPRSSVFDVSRFTRSDIYKTLWQELNEEEDLQIKLADNKPHRASLSAMADLDELLDEAFKETFPANDAVAIDIERESHEREARVPDICIPLASNSEGGAEGCTEALTRIPPARERVFTAEMQSKPTIAPLHADTMLGFFILYGRFTAGSICSDVYWAFGAPEEIRTSGPQILRLGETDRPCVSILFAICSNSSLSNRPFEMSRYGRSDRHHGEI